MKQFFYELEYTRGKCHAMKTIFENLHICFSFRCYVNLYQRVRSSCVGFGDAYNGTNLRKKNQTPTFN